MRREESRIKSLLLTGVVMMLLAMISLGGESYAARISGDEDISGINAAQSGGEVIMEGTQEEQPVPAPPEVRKAEVPASEPVSEIKAPPSERSEIKPAMKSKADDSSRKPKEVKAVKEAKEEKRPEKPVKRSPSDKYVTLDFDNVDIGVLVKFISELTGKNFLIDDKVKGKITVMSPKKIPVEDVYKVFLSVLEINGFTVVPAGSMTKIVPTAGARERGLETRTKKDTASPEDRMVTQIISLERANPDEIKRILDPIIPKTSSVLSYPPAGMLVITDYLSNIRRLQEIIGALDVEGAGEQISYIPIQNASASEVVKSLTAIFSQAQVKSSTAVRAVADSRTNSIILLAGVAATENVRKLIAFMDKDVPRGESNIQVYRLQNSIAEDLAKVLTNIVKESGAAGTTATAAGSRAMAAPAAAVVNKNVQVVPDKATNTLVIMAEREDYKVIESIIKQLDVPRPMVYIEALIMEVDANKDFKLGVEWRGIKETGQISGLDGSQSAAFIGSGGSGTSGSYSVLDGLLTTTTAGVVGAFPNGFALGMVGAGIKIGNVIFPSIGAVIQAYRNDTEVSILSTPQIMTMDNEEAEINVGSNVPYLTRQDTTSTTTSINYNSYEYKDVGVILNITPHINEENFVRLKISQQVTKVTSGVSTDTTKPSIPTTLKRTAKTTVVVKDSETIVIGGLVGDSTTDSTYKVPFFGDIPILGWLFKTKSKSREKTNLYVFLTPHIVRTQADAAKLYQEKRGSVAEVEEGVIKLNEKAPTGIPDYVPLENQTPANP
jgi:general secretion pathway protein D